MVIDHSTMEEAGTLADDADLLGKQPTALAEAQNTSDEASQTATVAAVLAPVNEDTAAEEVASTAAQHMAAEYGADATVSAMSGVLLTAAEAGLAAENIGTSVAVAALTSGPSHQVLSDIIANGATPESVAELAATVQAEMTSSEMVEQVKAAVHENKVAHRIKAIVADGGLSGIDSYQSAVTQAQENVAQAQEQLAQAQEQQAVAGQNAQSLTAQMLENPSNASMRGAVQQAVKDVEGAVIVTQQAEQSVAKAESQLAEAKETVTQSTLKKVREQAVQEIAAEEEQAAQEAAAAREQQELATKEQRPNANIAAVEAESFITENGYADMGEEQLEQIRQAVVSTAQPVEVSRANIEFAAKMSRRFGVPVRFVDDPNIDAAYDSKTGTVLLNRASLTGLCSAFQSACSRVSSISVLTAVGAADYTI